MAKQQVIAMKRHCGEITVDGEPFKMKLPKGCTGIMFCFESKTAARKYWGKDIVMVRIEAIEYPQKGVSWTDSF